MYKEIKKSKSPKFLVITPLKVGDTISKETKKSIKENKIQFDWISFEANNNIPTNTQLALEEYEKSHPKLGYLIKIDNDIKMQVHMLDKMYWELKNSDKTIAYVYCEFSYILDDYRQINFKGDFNLKRLMNSNYISSNSMIKRNDLEKIGGFITEQKYERLLDWSLWLKFAENNLFGKFIKNTKFTTPLNESNVSARGVEDYRQKHKLVFEDFVLPVYRNFFI